MIRRFDDRAPDPTTGSPDDRFLAHIREMTDPLTSDVSASRGAVWARVVADHPELAAGRPDAHSPIPLRAARPGGWRRLFDVAAAAAILLILLFGLEGVSFLPDDPATIPLGTQSAAAATPTEPAPAAVTDGLTGAMSIATPPWAGSRLGTERSVHAVGTTPP